MQKISQLNLKECNKKKNNNIQLMSLFLSLLTKNNMDEQTDTKNLKGECHFIFMIC